MPFSEKHARVKKAGHEFVRVPADEAEETNPHLREKSALAMELRTADEIDPASEPALAGEQDLEGGRFYDFPYRAPDERLDFPEHPHFEKYGGYLSSGVALHEVKGWASSDVKLKGFAASQLNIFDSDEWAFECLGVLRKHDWIGPSGNISLSLIEKLMNAVGEETIGSAKRDYGEAWKEFLFEVASIHFAEPLSRLWYAANMLSLYFARRDDLRLGYLWCEYRVKMEWETDALKRRAVAETNRENGKKGGQGAAGRERRAMLSRLVRDKLKETGRRAERITLKEVRMIADAHDKELASEDRLFARGGRGLSEKWYKDWLKAFRRAQA